FTGGSRRDAGSRSEKPANTASRAPHGVHRCRRRLPATWIPAEATWHASTAGKAFPSLPASPCRWRLRASAPDRVTSREPAETATTGGPDDQPVSTSAVAHGTAVLAGRRRVPCAAPGTRGAHGAAATGRRARSRGHPRPDRRSPALGNGPLRRPGACRRRHRGGGTGLPRPRLAWRAGWRVRRTVQFHLRAPPGPVAAGPASPEAIALRARLSW